MNPKERPSLSEAQTDRRHPRQIHEHGSATRQLSDGWSGPVDVGSDALRLSIHDGSLYSTSIASSANGSRSESARRATTSSPGRDRPRSSSLTYGADMPAARAKARI